MRVPMFCLALLSTSAGCDSVNLTAPSSSPPACIVLDDVINIPPGDATGTKDWGTYHPVTNIRESCDKCGQNTVSDAICTDSPLDPNVLTTYMQDGGVLTAQATDGTSAQGSINTDGTFILGAVITPATDDGEPTGQGLALLDGRFTGDRIVITMTLRMSINSPDGTLDLQSMYTVTQERVE